MSEFKIRSAVLERNKKITVRNLPEEELSPFECEVKIRAAGLCSSDIARAYDNGAYDYPLVMGHELAGELIRVGQNAQDEFSIGDKVCVFPLLPCFNCPSCEQKHYALCHDYSYYGSRCNGGFADRLNVNKWNLIKLPDGLNIEDCALLEPTTVALHAIEKFCLDTEKPSQICILGAGFLGLIAVQIINRFYPKCKVILVDRNKYKLDIGSKHGANCLWVGDSISWESFLSENANRFDNVVEFIGLPKTFSAAVHIASPKGLIVWAGNITGDLNLAKSQVSSILRKELTILGTWNSIYKGTDICDWTKTLDLISNGLKPSELISLRIGLDEINDTLAKLYAHKTRVKPFEVIKILVRPNA
jgi:L-iditol 2-dehydrogenase